MSSNQRNKRTCTEDTNCEKKSRRRDTYGKIAADQKEAMLLQRRTKKIELEKCNDSIKSVVECPSERMKSQRDTMLSKQSALTIRESSSANVKVSTLSSSFNKETSISRPFCVFERGSTSGTCKGQQDVSPEVISNTVGSSHETPNLSTVFDKGKDVGHSFCGFERGSTFGKPKGQQNASTEVVTNKGYRLDKIGYTKINENNLDYAHLKAVPNCKFCNAKRFQYEPPGFCCGSGSLKLISYQLPQELSDLYSGNAEESRHFRTYIRTYNNMFAFTSLGVTNDKDLARRYHGIYTFRVQGQMYHFIPDLLPSDKKAKNLQLYFYDNENELANRMAYSVNINESIVRRLMNVLSVNPYSIFLKYFANVPKLSDSYIALKCDSCLDQCTYNLPTATEIAGIWVQDNPADIVSTPHIRIYTHSNKRQSVNYYYGCYDPLQYPLLFPYGQNGWHCGIKKITRRNQRYCEHEELPSVKNMCSIDGFLDMEDQVMKKGKRKRETVSCREYYCYKFQIRENEKNEVLHCGRLFQQFIVDVFIKLETQRLDFYFFNQDLFRIDILQGIIDFLRLGETEASKIGKKIFLPVTFTGGPRDMHRRYMDAIALVQRFGKPDLFITMTCNPSWPEIKQHLLSTDETQNRPDLISRVFKAKVEELKKDILKRKIFGKVAAFMYTIEFQKRGLPHAHFLIILEDEYKLLTPESYDKFVCAERPDPNTEKHLHSHVLQHMMHGPCGDLNPTNSCMGKKGLCKFNYPKDFAEQTSKGKNSYPIYKRRNTGKLVHIREQYLDNSWVVPYSPYLLCKFDCHINVEVCSDIKVMKYIYKYICKGHDKIAFSVHGNEEIDEIKEYRSARWITPPEAAWRLFGFLISEMTPSVYLLQLHLEGQQFVSFRSTESVNRILNNPMIRKTMLTEFFAMNSTNEHAKDMQLLYKEFPEYFVWSPGYKMWTRRQKCNVIGRVVTCHPTEGERYYLRLLLMNVRGPKSYEDLRTVNGVPCSTFREAAEKRGLLYCNNSIIECMLEAVSYQMSYSLRRLFATLLVYCNPVNPKELWEMFEDSMSEDFRLFPNITSQSVRHNVLSHINDILHSMGHDINEYKFVLENIRASVTAKDAKDVHFERNIIVSEEDLLLPRRLNAEQLRSYNIIIDRISSKQSGAFFIDGPGGTGKTFLYRALLATIRSKGFIALATATSGVAASVLPGGRTVHSRFKMPINIDDNFCCNISKQSSLATLIRDAKLIVWDEASMAKKNMIEALDALLRDIMDVNRLFRGKVVVFGGDFRQTLPVVRNGIKEDFIQESLLYSNIWNEFEKLHLSENMRTRTDPSFCEYLLRIGNGKEATNCENKIEIPNSFVIPFTTEEESLDALFNITYPDLHAFSPDSSLFTSRVILTARNDFVNEINNMLITKFPERATTFVAIDETIEPNDQSQFEDFLHSLDPPDLPPYKLTLKENCPVILLRNLNPCEGLCNGTRLTCCDFRTHIISAKIESGDFKNTHVFIPRIPLLASQDEKISIQFKRTQFPLRLCFAMTINKAQGQTLDFVGIYLREPVFSHGQLYVALSRAKSSNCVKILIRPPTTDDNDDHSTHNVVYDEVIQKAFSSVT